MRTQGEVVYVETRGTMVRVGARSPDGTMWFWTTTAPAPQRGAVVAIPPGAKPEAPKIRKPPEPAEPVLEAAKDPSTERMMRAVALKAAATVCAGLGPAAEKNVLKMAEIFLSWLNTPQEIQL